MKSRRNTAGARALCLGCVVVGLFFHVVAAPVFAQVPGPESGRLINPNPIAGGVFGWSVSLSGDTAVVSDVRNQAVYVFRRDSGLNNNWTAVATLTPSDRRFGANFGESVSISGDTIVVGAVLDGDRGAGAGAVYVFQRDRGGPNAWGQVTKLLASGGSAGDHFGKGVAVSGDTAIVGAPQDGPPFPGRQGFAVVFARNHPFPDAWGEVMRLAASDGQPGGPLLGSGDQFGSSVALDGDTVIVGAPSDDHIVAGGTLFGAGSAYVFVREGTSPGVWIESAKLLPRDLPPFGGDAFGTAVSLSGGTAAIGTPGAFDGGAIYLFARDPQHKHVWNEAAVLQSPDASVSLGSSVAIGGGVVVAGAPDDDEQGGLNSRSGSTYVFRQLQPDEHVWVQVMKLTTSDTGQGAHMGRSVALDGGVAVVGAPTLGGGPGAAYACLLTTIGSATGACRRAVPVVNTLVTMSDLTTSCCDGSDFTIEATFTNISTMAIGAPFFEVFVLTPGVTLQNADGGPGHAGSTLTPDAGDGVLSPGEFMRVRFIIRTVARQRFFFQVNLRGEPIAVP